MIVEVTQSDIDNGVREDASRCPIAHAIKRSVDADSLSWVSEVTVDAYGASVDISDGGSLTLDIPKVAERFIEAFDRGEIVTPVLLDLDIRNDDRITW